MPSKDLLTRREIFGDKVRTSDRDGKGMVENRFALSGTSSHFETEEAAGRAKRFSNITFPSLSDVMKYVFSSSKPTSDKVTWCFFFACIFRMFRSSKLVKSCQIWS